METNHSFFLLLHLHSKKKHGPIRIFLIKHNLPFLLLVENPLWKSQGFPINIQVRGAGRVIATQVFLPDLYSAQQASRTGHSLGVRQRDGKKKGEKIRGRKESSGITEKAIHGSFDAVVARPGDDFAEKLRHEYLAEARRVPLGEFERVLQLADCVRLLARLRSSDVVAVSPLKLRRKKK
jgi:hypothetical protein